MGAAFGGLLIMIGLIIASNRISNAIQISVDAIIQQMELEQHMFDAHEAVDPKDLH